MNSQMDRSLPDRFAYDLDYEKFNLGLSSQAKMIMGEFDKSEKYLLEMQSKVASEKWDAWKENKDKLLKELNQAEVKIKNSETISDTLTAYVKKKEEDCEEIKCEVENLKKSNSQFLKEAVKTKEAIQNLKKDIGNFKVLTEKKISEAKKSHELFRDALGLSLHKNNEEGKLLFRFVNIDPKNPTRPFGFAISVSKDKIYEVSDCKPEISDLDSMVKKLNATNDVLGFVSAVRKRMKAHVGGRISCNPENK